MKHTICLLLSACMMLGLLVGCAAENTPYVPTGDALAAEDADLFATEPPDDSEPQELTLAYYATRSLNPITSTDLTNRTIFSLVYQGLFAVSRDYKSVPILCKNYRYSSDYRTYTVYLERATFSDGTALTVQDVIATYQAAKESTYFGSRFTYVKSIEPSEDGGITFTLNIPVEDFQMLLDVPIVKESEVEAESPLGTGPYIMEDGLTGAHLRRNGAWWCQSPDLVITASTIPLVAAESATQIRDEFEFNDVSLVCTDPCTDSYADYRCDYELWDCDNGMLLYLSCNVLYSDVFSNATLRSALTYAIDREALVRDYYRGFAKATTIPALPSSPYYSAGLAAKYEYDPLRFVEALGKVGLPKEPVELLVNKDDSLRLRAARDIAKMLNECGLETVVVEQNTKDYKRDIVNGKYDLYLGQTRLSVNMDLSPFFHPYGNLRYTGIPDPDLYGLCKDALENSGNFYSLHKAVADDGRITSILVGSNAVYATRGLLTELKPARDNVFFYTLGRTDEDAVIPIEYN